MGPRFKFTLVFVISFLSFCVTNDLASADTYTKLLLHGDGQGTSFVDSHSPAHTVTPNGNAVQSSAQSKWGSSIYLDGSGDYLSIPDSDDWKFGTDDFAVDFWVRFDSLNNQHLIGRYGQSNGCWGIQYVSNKLYWYYGNGAAYQFDWSPSSGTWYHVAITRGSGSLRFFVNGSQIGSTQSDSTNYNYSSSQYVGAMSSNTDYPPLQGYLDEVRVSKGTPRWTANFTPPTGPYDSLPTVTISAEPLIIDLKNGPASAALSWNSTNASGVTIEPGIGPVDPSGSGVSVTPVGTTKYTITATGQYGSATADVTVTVLNGYSQMGDFLVNGKIGIGTLNPQSDLAVNGIISAKEVKVTSSGWPDYVFDEKYRLPSLQEVEDFVRSNKHLPGIPPDKEIEEKGLTVSEMFSLQMRKIEELVLYVIELRKENDDLKRKLETIAPEK